MAGIAWINGKLLPPEQPAISPLDPGFLYGEGLFETMRAYRGKVFRLPQHLDRLFAGAEELNLTPPDRDYITRAVEEALAASELRDASVRLTLTPGPAGSSSPTLVILVRPLSLPPRELYERGCLAICVPAACVRETPLRRVKSLNYLANLLAQREAARTGAHEAIFVDPDGCVIEGAMRNIFAVINGELITPPLSRGLLPGITRAAVLEIAPDQDIPHASRDLPLTELHTADEAFLTSSLAEILPVAAVDDHTMVAPAPGPITRTLTQAYRSLVASELGL
jgi:branched-chain amino acid aminotransferase